MPKFPFPHTPSPSNVTELFQKISTISVPTTNVNASFLKSIGFKSSYDTYLVSVLKLLGFMSSDGTPSDKWKSYIVKKTSGSVMASAIKGTYSELFGIHPDAHEKGESQLCDFFKEKTGASDKDTRLMAQTFKNLCALADFETVPAEIAAPDTPVSDKERGIHIPAETPPGLTVNLNIQLTLPATEDESVYDKLFASLKKNLWPQGRA